MVHSEIGCSRVRIREEIRVAVFFNRNRPFKKPRMSAGMRRGGGERVYPFIERSSPIKNQKRPVNKIVICLINSDNSILTDFWTQIHQLSTIPSLENQD